MDRLKKILLGIAALAALALGGAAIAGATSGGNDNAAQERSEAADTDNVQDENGKDDGEGDQGLSADLKARLKTAALAETGGGTVGAMERDTEKGGTYEVEVVKPDGSQVDVRLDDQLNVLMQDPDGER
jgi:uncharacterized membrane protein YkoI